MAAPKKRKMTSDYDEWVRKAMEGCSRYPDGSINTTEFRKRLRASVRPDMEKAVDNLERDVWRYCCNEVLPDNEGQLWLFDNPKPEPYNPNQFILGPGEISFMINQQSTLAYKEAEARRSREHATDCLLSSNLKADRTDKFRDWTIEKLRQGQTSDLGFERFAIETGILRQKPDKEEAA
jgi:hypothetical protein